MTSLAESYKCRYYTPVYENEQKWGKNKSMETTRSTMGSKIWPFKNKNNLKTDILKIRFWMVQFSKVQDYSYRVPTIWIPTIWKLDFFVWFFSSKILNGTHDGHNYLKTRLKWLFFEWRPHFHTPVTKHPVLDHSKSGHVWFSDPTVWLAIP